MNSKQIIGFTDRALQSVVPCAANNAAQDSPQVAIEMRAQGLETATDELIAAWREHPELVQINALQIARAYGRLCFLCSALQKAERANQTKFSEAAE